MGIMSLAGRRPDVLLTPVTDNIRLNATIMSVKIRKYIFTSFNLTKYIKIDGKSDFMTGIQIAQMALKHRSNKSQRQRIVVFVASPI